MSLLLGFDIGGTNIKYMISEENLVIIEKGSFPTESIQGMNYLINNLTSIHHKAENKYKDKVLAIGIGCTGPLDIETGIIKNPYTLPGLEDQSFQKELEKKLGIKVYLDNDANTAHLGEIYKSKHKLFNSIMLTFGTGVGCSIRTNNEFLRINGFTHPEIGHTIVSTTNSQKKCYCGIYCAENILSGTALNRDALHLFNLTPEEIFDNIDTNEKRIFVKNIKRAFYELVLHLSIIFEPEEVIVGGGMQPFYSKYLIPELNTTVTNMKPIFGGTNIISAKSTNESGCFGAICSIIENQKRKKI